MTVQELINHLSTASPDGQVFVEGCDCDGEAGGIVLFPDGDVVIARVVGSYPKGVTIYVGRCSCGSYATKVATFVETGETKAVCSKHLVQVLAAGQATVQPE